MRRFAVVIACAAAGLLFAGPAADAQVAGKNRVVIDGSTTVGPIAKAFAEHYMGKHPEVNITVSESGSGNGAKSLIGGTCDIADMSRFMKMKEFEAAVAQGIQPVPHVVAMDGIAIIVHPRNPIGALTLDQLKRIYLGEIADWSELGGPRQKIVMISRDTNSGTYETFEKLVMHKAKIAPGVEYVGSNGAMRQRVQSTTSAIGYVGLGFVDETVKGLEIDGVEPTKLTVATGVYPIARPLFMFTNGYPKLGSPLHAFVTLHLTPEGQEIISEIGYVPVTRY